MSSAKIVTPLYREELPDLELRILRHNLKVMSSHEVVFVIPEGLDITKMKRQFCIDKYQIIRVSTEWLGRKNGVAGYNRMMLSEEFYALFSDVDYILICQTDAYIFRDELMQWVAKGFDYVGAPWGRKPIYDNILMRFYLFIRTYLHRKRKGFMKQDLFRRVGNGGFSLRHVEHFREACLRYSDKIEKMCKLEHPLSNEDVFWALVPRNFHYPNYFEALRFAIDSKPDFSFQIAEEHIPFGCHGLTNDKIYNFWRDKIEL